MTLLVSGASGMIGSALCRALENHGKTTLRLVRDPDQTNEKSVFWVPEEQLIDADRLQDVDAVVHLAGEPIAQRWTTDARRRIRESRVEGTRFLCENLASLVHPPKTFLCASAIGFYGALNSGVFTESSPEGKGFLAEVVRDWEAASEPLKTAGTRVAHMRFGVVLSPQGGALAKMLLPFKLGLGGVLGSGQQVMSWISLTDAVGVIRHLLESSDLSGIFNVVAPNPVSNAEFTAILGWALHRPTLLPVSVFLLQLLYGDMVHETILASQDVAPEKLVKSGYRFKHPELESALKACLHPEATETVAVQT